MIISYCKNTLAIAHTFIYYDACGKSIPPTIFSTPFVPGKVRQGGRGACS